MYESIDLSIVVPVKGNAGTIVATVKSLLAQRVNGVFEVIVVMDDDHVCRPELSAVPDGRLIVIAPPPFPIPGGRDANWRRAFGISRSRGEHIALTDADMLFDEDWAAIGLDLLHRSGVHCVAGQMRSIEADGFWGRYTDCNPFGAKTPRFFDGQVLTTSTLGRRGFKPVITANLFLSRELVLAIGEPRADITYSYEDYALSQDIVDEGYPILCSPRLIGMHHHRTQLRDLLREYHNAGRGCAQFLRVYPRSNLATRRRRQLYMGIGALGVMGAVARKWPIGSAVAGLTAIVAGGSATGLRTRSPEGAVYPVTTGVLSVCFVVGILHELLAGRGVRREELERPFSKASAGREQGGGSTEPTTSAHRSSVEMPAGNQG